MTGGLTERRPTVSDIGGTITFNRWVTRQRLRNAIRTEEQQYGEDRKSGDTVTTTLPESLLESCSDSLWESLNTAVGMGDARTAGEYAAALKTIRQLLKEKHHHE